jgi:Tol biopolymer transport system component
MAALPSLAPGDRVGPYEVLALLGEGGMGQVYRARDERLAREVAIKVVHADLAQDTDRLRRFEHEAKAAGTLNHPNIVAVYDTGESGGSPYIVSELLQGETLRDRMATGALGTRKAVDYAVQIARGLATAHDKGIVHRDLKPENLFLTKDGLVKILDFGIAKLGRPGEEKAGTDIETLSRTGTTPGTMLGTVGYMSPEQVRGLPTDHRSDLFSFGTVLYEMLTGKRAFRGTTAADTLSAILREDPTETLGTGSVLPAGLLRVVRRCLEKAPEDRFQTARDLAFALEGATTESRPVITGADRRAVRRRSLALALAVVAVLASSGLSAWLARRSAPRQAPPSYQRLTFRVGRVESARFAPDGDTIVYGAEWGASPSELFTTRAGATGSRPLGLRDAAILAVSSREEMAILLRPRLLTFATYEGTLARAPLAGGTPREVLEGVLAADWSPDGKELAVVHVVGERYRLEYPIGRVLYEPDPPTWLDGVSVSADGSRLAFVEHPLAGDQRGAVSIVGPNEPRRSLASGFAAIDRPRWAAGDREIWFSASRGGQPQQLWAVSLAGRERLVAESVGAVQLYDVSALGLALLTRITLWTEIRARARGASEETELPAADLSFLADLSDDGGQVLGTDVGQGGGPNFSFYVQKTDGSAPVWLGDGDGQALSPDGRFVLAVHLQSKPQQLVVTPTGAGQTRALEAGAIVVYSRAVWHPSGERVVIAGTDASGVARLYVQDVAGGPPRPLTGEGVTLAKLGRPVSPDGGSVVAIDPDGVPAIYPVAGGEPRPVPGLNEYDVPLCWTPGGRELLVARYEDTPPRVERVDVASGRTRPWHGLGRSLSSALWGQTRLLVTPDGESYAYGYMRRMNDLYLSSPLR